MSATASGAGSDAREGAVAAMLARASEEVPDGEGPRKEGLVRLTALAWLIERGLRRTASCMDLATAPHVAPAFAGAVEFEERGTDGSMTDRFWLSDAVMLYAAGVRAALAPVWEDHRATYARGVDLGRALGYFAPRGLPSRDEQPVHLYHFAVYRGAPPVELWTEILPAGEAGAQPGVDHTLLVGYLHTIGLALKRVGLEYRFELKNPAM